MPRFLPRILFLPLLAMLAPACSSYQLGSMLPPHLQTVHMGTAVNDTGEPLIENDVTSAVLAELQRDGSLSLANPANADTLLYVRLTQYELIPVAFENFNRSLPSEYRLQLRAEVELVERETGKTLMRADNVTGYDEFPLSGDLTQAKRIGLPGAAEDLGRSVVASVTEMWVE